VDAAEGAGPHQDSSGLLLDAPGGVVFEGVVATAEVGEIADVRGSAVLMVDGVVDVGPPHGLPASGESAVLVSCAQVSAQRFGGVPAVHGQDAAGVRVGEDPIPSGRGPCQATGRVGVDRGGAVQDRALVGRAGECGSGDRDLHDRAERFEHVDSVPVDLHRSGVARQEDVAEDVRAKLIQGALIPGALIPRACQMVCVRGGSPYGRKHTVGYRQGVA